MSSNLAVAEKRPEICKRAKLEPQRGYFPASSAQWKTEQRKSRMYWEGK